MGPPQRPWRAGQPSDPDGLPHLRKADRDGVNRGGDDEHPVRRNGACTPAHTSVASDVPARWTPNLVANAAKLDLATGQLDPAFDPAINRGRVTDIALTHGRLIIAGTFQKRLAALDPDTGYLDLAITNPLPFTTRTEVFKFDVSPDGKHLVAFRDQQPLTDPADVDQLHRGRHPALGRRFRGRCLRPGPQPLARQPLRPGLSRPGRRRATRRWRGRPGDRQGTALESGVPQQMGGDQILPVDSGVWFVTDGKRFNQRYHYGIRFIPLP